MFGYGEIVIFRQRMMIASTPPPRHGKSRKHASIACGQFLQELWTFLYKPEVLAVFTYQLSQVCITYPQSIYFSSKISNILGKKINVGHFCMIRKYVNLRTFFNPENWLADKN